MQQKNQKKLCYILVCLILLAGMHTSFEKVNVMAVHTVAASKTTIRKLAANDSCEVLYISEKAGSVFRETVGRIVQRTQTLRRELQSLTLFLCAICITGFILKRQLIEEILCLREKRYRKAIIKYIHDTDGKKRMSCLT